MNQLTSPARRGHEARNKRQRADVDQKPLETRPHHVSGACRVAAPVPRTGEQAHGLKTTSHPHAACGGGKSSEASRATKAHTQRVEDDEKALRTERKGPHTVCEVRESSEATASGHVQRWENKSKRRCSFQPDADDKRSCTTSFPRAETTSVAMALSDTRQSRDECLHGRTQLWTSVTRKPMPQEDITQTTPLMVAPAVQRRDRGEVCKAL